MIKKDSSLRSTPEAKPSKGIRLNKLLAQRGLASRREADRMIEDGRVKVNGLKAEPGMMITADHNVTFDGKALPPRPTPIYLKYHKPVGEICTTDRNAPRNVLENINHPERLFPVGRLDVESSGLLLLSNDGELAHRILRAQYGCEKEYRVTTAETLTDSFLRAMAEGVEILGVKTLPALVTRFGDHDFSIVLVQGLNRQIRRMAEVHGFTIVRLVRTRVGSVHLGDLRPGSWKDLSAAELKPFFKGMQMPLPDAVKAELDERSQQRRSSSTRPSSRTSGEYPRRPERRSTSPDRSKPNTTSSGVRERTRSPRPSDSPAPRRRENEDNASRRSVPSRSRAGQTEQPKFGTRRPGPPASTAPTSRRPSRTSSTAPYSSPAAPKRPGRPATKSNPHGFRPSAKPARGKPSTKKRG